MSFIVCLARCKLGGQENRLKTQLTYLACEEVEYSDFVVLCVFYSSFSNKFSKDALYLLSRQTVPLSALYLPIHPFQ